MNREEAEVIIETCLEAVHEQYVVPLTLALGALIVVACRDPDAAQQVAATLRKQAESCPPDVAGRLLLQRLAALADGPRPTDPAAAQAAVRKALRLIPGGRTDAGPGMDS